MGKRGRTWLKLVFPLDLQEVEKVGCCGMHLDDVLVWLGDGVRQGGYFEVMRTLGEIRLILGSVK
jgi:hypothetical protein